MDRLLSRSDLDLSGYLRTLSASYGGARGAAPSPDVTSYTGRSCNGGKSQTNLKAHVTGAHNVVLVSYDGTPRAPPAGRACANRVVLAGAVWLRCPRAVCRGVCPAG